MEWQLDRPASTQELVAIATALAFVTETTTSAPEPQTPDHTWRVAARIEGIGLVRRLPGKLEMRYISGPTRERLERATRTLGDPS